MTGLRECHGLLDFEYKQSCGMVEKSGALVVSKKILITYYFLLLGRDMKLISNLTKLEGQNVIKSFRLGCITLNNLPSVCWYLSQQS